MTNERRGQVPNYLLQHQQGKYTPEYKRLDIEPIQPGVGPNTPNAATRNFKVAQPQIGLHSPKRQLSPKHNVPPGRSMPVQVGNHEDQMWMDDSVVGPANGGQPQRFKFAADKMIDNNEFVNVEPHPVVAQQTRYAPPQEEIEYDEPQAGSSDYYSEEQVPELQADVIIKALNQSMVPGCFVIICNNQVIAKTTEEAVAKEVIQDLILQSVPVEDIFVCKRLNINFGVVFDG